MFVKLIKYDLKSMLKTMVPLWISAIVIGALIGISVSGSGFEERWPVPGMIYPMELLLLVLVAIFIAILVLSIIIVIRRFWDGLLKEEGYLMFTLPVSVRQLIFSKLACAVIVTTISGLCSLAVIGTLLAFSTQGSIFDLFDEIWNTLNLFYGDGVGYAVLILLSLISTMLAGIYRLYAAMAIGHLSNRNRFLSSFFAYIGIAIMIGFAESATLSIASQSSDLMMAINLIMNCIIIIVCHVVVELILSTRLNLE